MDVVAVAASNETQTTKHMNTVYEHKGYKIKKYNNAELLDPELKGVQWSLYEKGKGPENSSAFEFFSTLKEAKHYVDFVESQVIA